MDNTVCKDGITLEKNRDKRLSLIQKADTPQQMVRDPQISGLKQRQKVLIMFLSGAKKPRLCAAGDRSQIGVSTLAPGVRWEKPERLKSPKNPTTIFGSKHLISSALSCIIPVRASAQSGRDISPPVAQLDNATDSDSGDREFKSLRAGHDCRRLLPSAVFHRRHCSCIYNNELYKLLKKDISGENALRSCFYPLFSACSFFISKNC